MPIATKSALKKAIKKKWIKVDEQIASTATFIKGGETISLTIPASEHKIKSFDLELEIIYKDEYLMAIHKPAGILVSGNKFKTIANALYSATYLSAHPDATKPQPVHRLDYPTTGVLLIGRTNESIRLLNKCFEEKNIQKTYLAITIGEMEQSGSIHSTIDDKVAHTDYEIMNTVPSPRFGQLNLVVLKPTTGRRHQLRKHMASIGNPILGDHLYGKEPLILKGKGLYLHAYSIALSHPFTQKKLLIQANLPNKYLKIFPNSVL